MSNTEKASFRLEGYSVPKFDIDFFKKENDEIDLIFDPSGNFMTEDKRFILRLDLEGKCKDQTVLNVICLGYFEFENVKVIEDIPEFFYANSIAILFPYLRSFVSTLSLQANVGLIILDTLNLTRLKDVLKGNTTSDEQG